MLNTWVLYRSLSYFKNLYFNNKVAVFKKVFSFNIVFYKRLFLILSIIVSLFSLIYYSNYFNSPTKLYTDTKTTYHTLDQNIDTIRQGLIKETSRIPVNNGILNNDRVVSYDGYEIFKEYTKKIETNTSDKKQDQQEIQQLILEQKTLKILERELKRKQQIEEEKQIQLALEIKKAAEKQEQQSQQEQQVEQEQQIQPAVSLSSVENQVLILLNNTRSNHGLNPLNIDGVLTNIARSRSKDMIDRGYFSHYTPDGTNIFNFLKANGISYRAAGENLGRSSPPSRGSAGNFIDAWMKSESHRINMLRGAYTKIGIGVIDQNNTRIVTIVFTG